MVIPFDVDARLEGLDQHERMIETLHGRGKPNGPGVPEVLLKVDQVARLHGQIALGAHPAEFKGPAYMNARVVHAHTCTRAQRE
jgi:hypothetical protein